MKRYWWIAIVGMLSFFAISVILWVKKGLDDFPGIDHYTYVDENKRYQMSLEGELDLYDNKKQISIASDIEKYIQIAPYIYVINDDNPLKSAGWTKDANGKIFYNLKDPNTGESFEVENFGDVPRYTILNYITGEARQYKTLDEVPESDRAFFEQPLTKSCIQERTCYEKEST